jgi:acetyl esterase
VDTSRLVDKLHRRPPPQIERAVQERGAVLDMPFVKSVYEPLLAAQPREGVEVVRDLVYGADLRHRVDLYQPRAGSSMPRTAVLLIHGGGFVRGDKSEHENAGYFLARHGYVAAVANYRLAPAHSWPAGAEDVISAYQWLRAKAASLNIDHGKIYLAGESAGAAHVATAALMRRFHPADGLAVAGIALVSGVYNPHLERLARRQFGVATPDPRNDAYFGLDAGRYPQMSIVDLVDVQPIRTLITYAELDLLQMQVQAGELFSRLVIRHGFAPELEVIRGHNHLSQFFSLNTEDESLSAALLDFFR